jgi:hypothetical protein
MGVELGFSHYGNSTQMTFANRTLKRIFGSENVEVTGGWRKLHEEKLHDLYSPNIRVIKWWIWADHVAHTGQIINA